MIFTLLLLYNAKVTRVYKNWPIYKIVKVCKSYKIILFFRGHGGVFGTQSNIYGGAFLGKKLTAESP